jgi:hypothetical protein
VDSLKIFDEEKQEEVDKTSDYPFRKGPSKLRQEIGLWSTFAESLRLEDRQVFKEMMQKTWAYSDSVEICKDEYETEALLVSILLSHQKMINWISGQLDLLKNQRKERR